MSDTAEPIVCFEMGLHDAQQVVAALRFTDDLLGAGPHRDVTEYCELQVALARKSHLTVVAHSASAVPPAAGAECGATPAESTERAEGEAALTDDRTLPIGATEVASSPLGVSGSDGPPHPST